VTATISKFFLQHDTVYYALLAINIGLIVFAPWVVRTCVGKVAEWREQDGEMSDRFWVNMLRGLNVLIIALLGHFRFYGQYSGDASDNFGVKVVSILVVVYLSYLAANLIGRLIRKRFGKAVQSGSVERVADTYASRILSLFSSMFVAIMALISIVRIAGFSNLLEAGGVIGIFGVILALTQGAWAPDIISGLIILNTKLLAERDVIRITDNGEELYAIVHRTRAFHTELLNLVDNHRLMIRNSQLRDHTVHNLSRYASAKGLRETLRFKLSYEVRPEKVRAMFNAAYEAAHTADISIEFQHPLEIRLQDAGDHAVEWSVHYFTKDEYSLIATRQAFRECILDSARLNAIDLSTPVTISQIA